MVDDTAQSDSSGKKAGKAPESELKAEPLKKEEASVAPAIIIKRAPLLQAQEKKDVPMGLVLLVGVLIWVLVFGTIFSYAAFSPCSFVAVVIGERKTLETMADRLSMDFSDDAQCRHFLRLTVIAPGFVPSES